MNGLILTLVLGLFIIAGGVIVFLSKNSDKFIEFSLSMAFGVIGMLLIFDLFPETWETINTGNRFINCLMIFCGACIGFFFLRILDRFIPDHEDDLSTTEDDERNLNHIGLVSSIALVIHNIVEGIAIYTLYMSDAKAGIMAGIGVGLHNIPLGMVIASTFYRYNKKKSRTSFILLGISLSTFLGGLLMYFFPLEESIHFIESISLTVTLGMLFYILIMELIPKIRHTKYKKMTVMGLVTGILLLLIPFFI